MNKTTKKKVTSKILESWYAIDSVLFNGHARQAIKEGKVFQEYVALKASILSNLYEYYEKVQYSPSESIATDLKTLQENAVSTAKQSKALAGKLLKKESVKKKLKTIVMSEASKFGIGDVNEFGDKVIQEKFLELALDNLMIGVPILESRKVSSECNVDCKILENAHRMMRSSLVRLALTSKKI